MYESYIKEYKIKDKTEEEQKREIVKSIIETKNDLKTIRNNFEYAEEGLIDFHLYQIKAYQSKLDYLIKKAKNCGIIIDRMQDIEIRKEEIKAV